MTGKTTPQARKSMLHTLRHYGSLPADQRFSILFVTPERFCRDTELQAILRDNAVDPGQPAMPRAVKPERIAAMKVAELKDELRRLGLKVGGKKAELVARLQECINDGGGAGAPEQTVRTDVHNARRFRRLVVDEAHCISEWGDGFRPEYHDVSHYMQALCGHLHCLDGLQSNASIRRRCAILCDQNSPACR